MTVPKLSTWLQENRDFTLTLSSGFFGFYAHCGFLRALDEAGYRPQRICGASAGALVGGLYAAGLTPSQIAEILVALRRQDFWDPGLGFGLLRGTKFRQLLNQHLPCQRIEACRIPITFSVFNIKKQTTESLDTGSLAEAIYASCAVPGLFHPLRRDRTYYMDGGFQDRPAFHSVKDTEAVLHHHLPSRSRWRLRKETPKAPNDRSFVLSLPQGAKLGPFALDQGKQTIDDYYRDTMLQLNKTLS